MQPKSKWFAISAIFISIVGYFYFAYFLHRSNFYLLISIYSILFLAFYYVVHYCTIKSKMLCYFGLAVRLLLILAIPNLSQDFFRFIWDGRMLPLGYNPYLYLPDNLINNSSFLMPQATELYEGMGSLSSGHFTNYPPVNLFCFYLAALFAGKSIIGSVFVFKVIIIAADLGIYIYGKKILALLQLPEKNIFYYFLNPLVIVECTGNLHFEGLMLFFLVIAFYKLQKRKNVEAAIFIGLSIAVKLVPLILLPIFFKYFKFKKLVFFYGAIGILLTALFAPFFSSAFFSNYSTTVGLWFVNFEFNASFYYLARYIGFQLVGYNTIGIIGKVSPFVIIGVVLYFSFFKNNATFKTIISNMLFAICIYFFLSTTVHPWYIITPVVLSVFTNYRFPVLWSFVVMFSYYAYSKVVFAENYWLIAISYTAVFAFMFIEVFMQKKILIKA